MKPVSTRGVAVISGEPISACSSSRRCPSHGTAPNRLTTPRRLRRICWAASSGTPRGAPDVADQSERLSAAYPLVETPTAPGRLHLGLAVRRAGAVHLAHSIRFHSGIGLDAS